MIKKEFFDNKILTFSKNNKIYFIENQKLKEKNQSYANIVESFDIK